MKPTGCKQSESHINYVAVTLVTALTAAPWSSRKRIIFTWPKWHAVCNGVYPAYDITGIMHTVLYMYSVYSIILDISCFSIYF